jgi:hypothetical protein
MMKTRLSLAMALGLVAAVIETAPLTFAQNSQSGSKSGNSGSSQGNVTTNDSALPQNDTNTGKKNEGGDKKKKAPKSPPNPPVADQSQIPDSHENPASPANKPKTK